MSSGQLKMHLWSDSGYECEETHQITDEQWEKIQRILHGTEEAAVSVAETTPATKAHEPKS